MQNEGHIDEVFSSHSAGEKWKKERGWEEAKIDPSIRYEKKGEKVMRESSRGI